LGISIDGLAFRAKFHEKPLTGQEYDEHRNYEFSRSHGAIPIIDYNPRNEKLTSVSLKERGYDQNGPAPLENLTYSTFCHLLLFLAMTFNINLR